MSPRHPFNKTFATPTYTDAKQSWWIKPMTREKFDAKAAAEQHRMTWSRGANWVNGAAIDDHGLPARPSATKGRGSWRLVSR